MAAGKQRDEQVLDDRVLADDHLAQLVAQGGVAFAEHPGLFKIARVCAAGL